MAGYQERGILANNGRDAIAKIKETDFDIVLLDLLMPEIDGLTGFGIKQDLIVPIQSSSFSQPLMISPPRLKRFVWALTIILSSRWITICSFWPLREAYEQQGIAYRFIGDSWG